jgi:hypothetical protein
MKQFFLFSLTVLLTVSLSAQQNHYIYIQTENKQPFYVKLDNKVFSSSASGYVIIPKLQDGSYAFGIGFPKKEWPEQNVTVRIDKKDEGYVLKNFGDKGWGLFNIQTLNVIMAGAKGTQAAITKPPVSNDGFSNTLSNVVNDPGILQKEATKEETTPVAAEEKTKASITKVASTKNADGTQVVYVDVINGKPDTVKVLIPAKDITEPANYPVAGTTPVVTEKPVSVAVTEKPKEETVQSAPAKKIMINSDCKNFASADDFMKLRKKMIGENSEDDMVTVARKVFKTRCFTTEQVKNLGVLFLKDEGKYKLFDAAYPFVSDSGNFSTLKALLTDEYYINRFNAMITKH